MKTRSTRSALHAHTPTILVADPRSLVVGKATYYRCLATDTPQARIERVERDAAGRLRACRDARLAHPVRVTTPSLSGVGLRSEHVDAGWYVDLPGAAHEPAYAWNARRVTSHVIHDDQRRVVALYQGIDEERCVERLSYGAVSAMTGVAGRLVRHDDASGSVQVVGYSLHGQPLLERRRFLLVTDEPDWPEALAERDRLVEDEAFESFWRYDAHGTIRQQIDAGVHVRRYVFDIAGRPTALHVALDGVAERMVSTGAVYDAEGRVTGRRDGDVAMEARFDPASGHQVGLIRTVAGHAIQDLIYTYDGVGNVTSMSDVAQPTDWFDATGTDPLHRYEYDTLDQLIRATGRESVSVDGAGTQPPMLRPGDGADSRLRDYVEGYEYDAGGNLVAISHTAAGAEIVRRFTIDAASNRAVPVGEKGVITFDATGNRLQLRPGVAMTWDTRGHLVGVGSSPGDERYRYGVDGMRTRKVSAVGDVRYLSGMERRIGPDGTVCDALHLPHAGGLTRIVHWRRGVTGTRVQDSQRIQITDLLGSVCLETMWDGTVLTDETFHPFGSSARRAARDDTMAEGKARRYGGKEADVTGLSYYGHRYYAPWLGRWISPDPAGDVDGSNRYRFARNNPCSGTDADGLMFEGLRRRYTERNYRAGAAAISEQVTSRALEVGRVRTHYRLKRDTVATHVDAGLHDALSAINRATHVLFRAPELARSIVSLHLGYSGAGLSPDRWEATRHALFEGLDDMRNDLLPLRADTDRRLVLVGTRRVPDLNLLEGGFVYEADPHRRIFLNADFFQSLGHLTPDGIRDVLLHEPTHLFPRARATKDVKYFGSHSPLKDSVDWAMAYVPPGATRPVSDKSAEARAIRRMGPTYDHMSFDEQRRHMILHNADSWRVITLDLAGQTVDP